MNAREWLNVLAILESIDEVPGMPRNAERLLVHGGWITRTQAFVRDPVRFFRHADDATRDAIWAEVERRQAR